MAKLGLWAEPNGSGWTMGRQCAGPVDLGLVHTASLRETDRRNLDRFMVEGDSFCNLPILTAKPFICFLWHMCREVYDKFPGSNFFLVNLIPTLYQRKGNFAALFFFSLFTIGERTRECRCLFTFNSESTHFVSVWKQIRKMRQHFWCFHLICSCRIRGFSAHGPTLLLVLGILPRVFTIQVQFLSCNWCHAHCSFLYFWLLLE